MSKCCQNHPQGCPVTGGISLIIALAAGFLLGWKWVLLILLIGIELDQLIRVYKHK
jgi:hypothetical protein